MRLFGKQVKENIIPEFKRTKDLSIYAMLKIKKTPITFKPLHLIDFHYNTSLLTKIFLDSQECPCF